MECEPDDGDRLCDSIVEIARLPGDEGKIKVFSCWIGKWRLRMDMQP
jgi:hypothetical protein